MTGKTVTGTAGDDTLVITATDFDDGSYVFNSGGAINLASPSSFTFNGNGGNDAFTIFNPAGDIFTPSGGITFNGGGQSGDSFLDLGGTADGGAYAAGGAPDAGILTHLVSEQQKFTVSGNAGTFTLTFNGQTTGSIAFNATAATVQGALAGLSSIGGVGGSVGITQIGGVYTVTFGGSLADSNESQITATGSGGTSVVTATLRDGGAKDVQLTGVATVTDTVAEHQFTVNGTAGADAINVSDGPVVDGQATMQVGSPTFETLDIANKDTVFIGGNGGGDTVTFGAPNPAAGLTTVIVANVNSVEGGNPSGPDLTVPDLILITDAGIGAGGALRTQVSTLLAEAGLGGAGNINISNGAATPTTLAIHGLQATNAAGGTIVLTNSGTINIVTLNDRITATGLISITANGANSDINTGNQPSAAIVSNTGSVTLGAVRDINLGDSNGNGSIIAAAGIVATSGRNFTLDANARVSNSTAGNISVAAGGNLSMFVVPGNVSSAPVFQNTASGGSIALGSGAGYTMTLDSTGTDAVASSNGLITLSADAMVISKGLNAGTARVALRPASSGQAISLGGVNLPGVLGLSQAELNEVTAGVLQIGSPSAGNISLTSSITPTPNSNVLTLISGGSINEKPGASLAALNLRFAATKAVTLNDGNNAVQVIAGAGASSITIVDAAPLIVGVVDGTAGIAGAGPIDLEADNIDIQQAINAGTGIVTLHPLSTSQQIALGGSDALGTLGLNDTELGQVTASVLRVDGQSGDIQVANALTRHAGYKTLSLETGGTIFQAAALSVANLALRGSGDVFLTNPGNNADTLAFANIGGVVLYTDANALTIGAVDGLGASSNTGSTTLITAGKDLKLGANLFSSSTILLTSTSGAINDIAAGDVVTVPTLLLSAATGIGSASTVFHTQVDDLGADAGGGGIFLINGVTSGVTLNIAGADGVVASGGSADIQLTNEGSILTLTDGATINAPGTVTIKAQGATSDFNAGGQSSKTSVVGADISIRAGRDINLGDGTGFGKLTALTGSLTLSSGRNITLNANSVVASKLGGLTATAGGSIIMKTSPGNLAGAPVFATGGGAISLSAGAGHSMTLASTGTNAVNSNGGNITLTGDSLFINAGVNAGKGNVQLQSASAGEAISLGTASGGLHLTQAKLDEVTANTLTIGNTLAGTVTVGGAVGPASVSTLTVKSGADVVVNAGAALGGMGLTKLNVAAGGDFTAVGGASLIGGLSGTVSIGFGGQGLGATADLHNVAITATTVNVTGGAGDDIFEFSIGSLTSAVTVLGAAGNDQLVMNNAGMVATSGVSGVETFQLADGGANTLTLKGANFAGVVGGVIRINDGDSGNTITATTLPAADAIIVHAGTGTDTLKGGLGDDILFAGGKTTMTGGVGANRFTFADIGTNTIADFGGSASNMIVLRDSGFNLGTDQGLGTNSAQHLAASVFSTKTDGTFNNTSERFAYNASTGKLFYSANGSGSAGSAIVTLTGHPGLSAGTTGNLFFTS